MSHSLSLSSAPDRIREFQAGICTTADTQLPIQVQREEPSVSNVACSLANGTGRGEWVGGFSTTADSAVGVEPRIKFPSSPLVWVDEGHSRCLHCLWRTLDAGWWMTTKRSGRMLLCRWMDLLWVPASALPELSDPTYCEYVRSTPNTQ